MKSLLIALTASLGLANSLYVRNDSSFTLTAEVVSAQGASLGMMEINPGGEFEWEDPYGGHTEQGSTTPYTVIWTCQSGMSYGVTSNVAAGATTNAQDASGPRNCLKKTPLAPKSPQMPEMP